MPEWVKRMIWEWITYGDYTVIAGTVAVIAAVWIAVDAWRYFWRDVKEEIISLLDAGLNRRN